MYATQPTYSHTGEQCVWNSGCIHKNRGIFRRGDQGLILRFCIIKIRRYFCTAFRTVVLFVRAGVVNSIKLFYIIVVEHRVNRTKFKILLYRCVGCKCLSLLFYRLRTQYWEVSSDTEITANQPHFHGTEQECAMFLPRIRPKTNE